QDMELKPRSDLSLLQTFTLSLTLQAKINTNCSAFDQEDYPSIDEADTKVGSIPDLTLDEWENKVHAFDPYQEIEESELGVYCMHEENQPIPSITKPNHKDDNE
ncbi:hypothetical protein KI387_022473, partial [Taxus chinensis]